ncbi:hypothetical protein RSOLAG1IB_06682 [Rhizoctonia solani AG-1 IB]|uniref:Uncharacterized protein n=1 Tax=Thanatephorus cucumeris (strain AG1-IB / isolate 7/3/14) TaxID=1108050 RepID=A0A0B7F8M1_THACB|nr:hypothetical protein RSOLAG1IB_06682 [Rhizoctonia solani AG-1 IB]
MAYYTSFAWRPCLVMLSGEDLITLYIEAVVVGMTECIFGVLCPYFSTITTDGLAAGLKKPEALHCNAGMLFLSILL